jgi:hypothetical protein
MDITNNVYIPNLTPLPSLFDTVNIKTDEESSDYNVSVSSDIVTSKNKKQTVITDELIQSVLNGMDFTVDLDNYNQEDLNKNSFYNKLNSNEKNIVINRLLEKMPKHLKIQKNTDGIVKTSYFYCNYCGYNEQIPEKTFIFSRISEKSSEYTHNSKFANFKYDHTLPISKKYNCINKDCDTHKKPELKSAVMFRIGEGYSIRYICSVCNYYWTT